MILRIYPPTPVPISAPLSPLDASLNPYSLVTDFSVSNVDDTDYVEILAATTHKSKSVQIFMSSGTPLHLAFGGLGSEADKIMILPGGNGVIPLTIPEATRLSVKALSGQSLVDAGLLIINFLG